MANETIINAAVKAYVEVMGIEKWRSLTVQEQHDAIMIMIKDLTKLID